MDMSQYRALFLAESREYLEEMGRCVVALDSGAGGKPEVDALFRAAHSLKGMALSMEFEPIVALAHSMEDLMVRVRDGALSFDRGIGDLLLEGADLLEGMMQDLEAERPLRGPEDLPLRLSSYSPGQATAPKAPEPAPEPEVGAPAEPAREALRETPAEAGFEPATVRVRTELLDHLANLTGELLTNKQRLLSLAREVSSSRLDEALTETNRLLRSLQDEVARVRLMPFDAICPRLERSVRDVSRKSGKQADFVIEGREIGLDRGVLEQLGEPLNHILKNAVDHGLEPAEERQSLGKPERGTVTLSVTRDRDQVVILVTDDGRGMDPAKMIASAVKKGLIDPDEGAMLSPRQALMLSVIPGFSTAGKVTEVSGRGVGMDAVNSTIRRLGGILAIDSQVGSGSRFTLRLPMTIATVHALLVRCGKFKGAVPVSAVQRSVELRREQIRSESGRQVFYLGDEPVPVLSLNRILGLPLGRFPRGFLPVFVTEVKGRQLGLVVDELLGQHELYIKPLGRPLGKVAGVAGGAILGDGEIVPVLDLATLM
ncbi:chemotaxis protein CheA [Geomonas sp. Red875]|uniref:histidine kinase n=2 Tax=Geomesophilobacter sediminis TaxID=2798584 RepID=A0A8J7M3C6_9BACT|nr:chemotaxis protein CheA [Geomesophilobacter sediminis]